MTEVQRRSMSNEELVTLIQAGTDVTANMQRLYEQNIGFIGKLAGKYYGIVEQEDLKQEAYFGLYHAAQAYKPDEGSSFIHYAAYWIRQSMRRYIDENALLVRLPSQAKQQVIEYRRMISDFERSFGRRPSEQETALSLGVSVEQVRRIARAEQMANIGSLDVTLTDEDQETTVCDLVPGAADVEGEVLDKVQQEELQAVIWPLVDALPEKQSAAIRLRYQEGLTLKATGERLGTSFQAVREYERRGFGELRKTHRARVLLPFLDVIIRDRALKGNGLESFRHTWTSSTERVAIYHF